MDSYSDQDSEGVSDSETDPDSDFEGDVDMALDPGLDGGFRSTREMDLGPRVRLDPGLISYAPSNLYHDLDRDSTSDLLSDAGVYLHDGHPRIRCPFSLMTSASREIP